MTRFERTVGYFRQAVEGPPESVPLGRAALLIAQSEYPGLDIDRCEARIEELAEAGVELLPLGASPADQVLALNDLLFRQQGFQGNVAEYSDPRNLLLNDVLERRIGIPVSLAIVQVEVAQRCGLDLRVVGLPGHVVTRIETEGEPAFFDPFQAGRQLTAEECRALVRTIYGRRMPFQEHYLDPITPRQTLQRVLHNLKAGYLRDGDEERSARILELLLALYPWDLDEIRDRGMLRERVGEFGAALTDLELYLRYRAGARDVQTVSEAVRSLRRHVDSDAGDTDLMASQ